MAFVGLLGATAVSRSSDAAATQPSDDDTFDQDEYEAHGYGYDEYDGSSAQRATPPGWGGSAQAGGGPSVPDSGTSNDSSAPTLRSEGS